MFFRCSSLALVLVASGLLGCDGDAVVRDTVATTPLGDITGNQVGSIAVFKGIPYAQPPVGALRYMPPAPITTPFAVPFAADDFGPICMQSEWSAGSSSFGMQSEDCLSLNVYTPSADGVKRPVMVFVHGGAFRLGAGSQTMYDPSKLVDRGDVVVVTFNYRMGVFGFLDLSVQGGSAYASTANLGILDQAQALRWVRQNIQAFGGDPANVTVFGESAGSISIGTLLGMPNPQELFDRAILESGTASGIHPQAYASKLTQDIFAAAGVTDLAGWLALDAASMIAAQKTYLDAHLLGDLAFGPTIDGVSVPEAPGVAIAAGNAADIPLLQGTCRDETRLWLEFQPILAFLGPESIPGIAPWLPASLGQPKVDEIVAAYSAAYPTANPADVLMKMATDLMFRLPHIRLAEEQLPHAPVYAYRFDWVSPYMGGYLGSPHANELPFVFFNLAPQPNWLLGNDPPEALAEQVADAWVSFARHGDPNHGGMPTWPLYDTTTRRTMIFDEQTRVVSDPDGADRVVWDGIPFDGLTPHFE